jgi:NAD:arginine ADP-ribosyltransferase
MNIIPSSARIEFQNLQEQHKLLHTQEQKALDLTRAINQQLNQISNRIGSLKTQKKEFETDAFLYTTVANKYDLAEKKFSERIAYLGNIERKPLRLKDGRIKLMEYRGWNLFKRGIERPEYAKQADDLRSSCHLPEGAPTDAAAVRAHLTTQREHALQKCNALTTKVEGLKLQWDQLSSQKKEAQSEHRKLLNASFPNWREDKRRLDQLNRKLAQLDSKLKASPSYPIKLDDFATIWSTNAGCQSIQSSLKAKKSYPLDNKEILRELNARHDYDLGTKRGADKTNDIKFASLQLSCYKDLDDQCLKIYQRTLTPIENGASSPKSATVFRVANLSEKSQFGIHLAMRTHGALIKPNALLACAKTEQGAVDFEQGLGQRRNTLFVIKGCSQIPMGGALAVASEQESVFSPYALFKVESIEKKNDRNVVTLTEQLTSMNHKARNDAYELDL